MLAALCCLGGKIGRRWRIDWDLGMTLAVILSLMICCTSSALPLVAAGPQNAPQAAPTSKADETPATQDQGTAPSAQNPPTPPQPPSSAKPPAQTSSGQTRPATVKKPRHKKKATTSSNCVSDPATAQPAPGSTQATDPVPAGSAPGAGTATAPTNCPPSKVIVRQGGTSEPSIQLAGRHRRPDVAPAGHSQPNAGNDRSEPQEDRRTPAQLEPAGHGQPDPPVHGAVEGRSRRRGSRTRPHSGVEGPTAFRGTGQAGEVIRGRRILCEALCHLSG